MSVFNKLKTLKDAIVGTNFRTGDGTGTTALGTKHLQVKDLQPYFNDGYTDSVEKRGGFTVNTKAFDWGGRDFSITGIDGGVVTVTSDISGNNDAYINKGVNNWENVAMSGDGKYQVALLSYSNDTYKSDDFGVTWSLLEKTSTDMDTVLHLRDVAISIDGRYQTIVSGWVDEEVFGTIYRSSDYGVTWEIPSVDTRFYKCIDMSDSGKYQTVTSHSDSGGIVIRSENYGVTWTKVHISKMWNDISISGDGKYQILCSAPHYTDTDLKGRAYISSNYGVGWNVIEGELAASRIYETAALSEDGKYQTICVNQGTLYTSSNFGVDWVAITQTVPYDMTVGTNYWTGVAMSSDGMYQKLISSTTQVITSSNYGVTWVANGGLDGHSKKNIAMSNNRRYITINGSADSSLFVSNTHGNTTPYTYIYTGDIFQISGARKFTNNGIYEVKSVLSNTITMESASSFGKTTLTNDTKQTGEVHKVNVTTLTCDTDSFGQSVWKTKNGSSIVELKRNELTLSTNRNRIEILPSTTLMYDQQYKLSGELPEVYIVETGSVENGEDVTLKLGYEIKPGTEVRVVRKGKNKVILTSTVGFDGEVGLGSIDLDRDDQKVCLVYFSDFMKETWYIVG